MKAEDVEESSDEAESSEEDEDESRPRTKKAEVNVEESSDEAESSEEDEIRPRKMKAEDAGESSDEAESSEVYASSCRFVCSDSAHLLSLLLSNSVSACRCAFAAAFLTFVADFVACAANRGSSSKQFSKRFNGCP